MLAYEGDFDPIAAVASSLRNVRPVGPMASTCEIIAELQAGRMVVLTDDEDRENEGDLVMPADLVTAKHINFMITHARGLVCLALEPARAKALGLRMMVDNNECPHQTAFTVSIEARRGVTTGISAADRALTVRTAVDPASGPHSITSPGHIFPLVARDGGVLERQGHTEASVDLAIHAGFCPAAVICEILNEDGTMSRLPDLKRFAIKHGLKIGTIAELCERIRGGQLAALPPDHHAAHPTPSHLTQDHLRVLDERNARCPTPSNAPRKRNPNSATASC